MKFKNTVILKVIGKILLKILDDDKKKFRMMINNSKTLIKQQLSIKGCEYLKSKPLLMSTLD